ncbi:hypothetical protein STENM223S_11905 [Streptomyces tendae]
MRTTPPGEGSGSRSPEFRLAVNALSGLREDLFHDAFAYRPLPRAGTDGPVARRLPARLKPHAARLPHAVVAALALLCFYAGTVEGATDGPLALLSGLVCAAPVLATLVRPVGAFWMSMAATPVVALLGSSWGDWPWLPGAFLCHTVVLVIVAIRTRPRTAAWMWALTAAYGLPSTTRFWGAGHYGSNPPPPPPPPPLPFRPAVPRCAPGRPGHLRDVRAEPAEETAAKAVRASLDCSEYVRALIAARRKEAGADLISGLIAAHDEDDDRLTEQEMIRPASWS